MTTPLDEVPDTPSGTLHCRIGTDLRQRVDAVVLRYRTVKLSDVVRCAIRIGLEAIEADPTRLLDPVDAGETTLPPPGVRLCPTCGASGDATCVTTSGAPRHRHAGRP